MPRPARPGPTRLLHAVLPLLLLANTLPLRAAPPPAAAADVAGVASVATVAAPRTAVVTEGTVALHVQPDETSAVEDQAVLGDRVELLEETAGFSRIRGRDGQAGWVPAGRIVRGTPAPRGQPFEVVSPMAHLYATPSFDSSRPVLTTPLGARVDVVRTFEKEKHDWAEVRLPDGRRLYAAATDLAPEPAERKPVLEPASWLAMAKRFLGAPYTWGGTTPAGFDCSGLVWRVLERHGIVLRRNSSEMCWREPQLVAVRLEEVRPGDLVFFGTTERIDHVGFWAGEGTVLQATAFGVPSTQLTPWSNERLSPRFVAARRLAALPGAPKPAGLDETTRASLERTLSALAADGTARYGIVFKDLASGRRVALNASESMHAASTMKTPVMLEALRRVEDGTLDLEKPVAVKAEFRSVVDGSPFTCDPEPEADAEILPFLGRTTPLSLVVNAMITRSSNIATNLLLEVVGVDAVQRLVDSLGAPTVRVRRMVSDTKAFDAGINNETDAAGMAALMEAAVRSPKLSPRVRERAFAILAAQHWNEQIPAGIPKQAGAVVAHKTGSISTVQHDAGVVRLPDGREYVLVLMASGFKGDAARQKVYETTRKMSRACWEAVVAP